MTAESLIADKNLKFIFVGGKGGVGKTTVSSSIAMQCSYDRKVLLLSTDPAHSLSDAFRCSFTDEPTTVDGIPNLDVLEVNPDKILAAEIKKWAAEAESAGFDELLNNVKEFQQWLTSVPGIDEATALSNVLKFIEKGSYDVIVFDTAPTGHTLKLLQLPKVLEAGLNKLNSWQSKIWGYWRTIKGAASGKTNLQEIQKKVTKSMEEYKVAIEKIGIMLKDKQRTNFAVVCIAEYLSINESTRLLNELERHEITVSHIFVNMLVQNALLPEEMISLDAILDRANPSQKEKELLNRMRSSVKLCNARRNIQQSYLTQLKQSDEVKSNGITVAELPLLPIEVTGAPELLKFSQLFMPEQFRTQGPSELKEWEPSPYIVDVPRPDPEIKVGGGNVEGKTEEKVEPKIKEPLKIEDSVRIDGLNATQYNGLEGKVCTLANSKGRIGVVIDYQGEKKQLLLKEANLTRITLSVKEKLLADPEVKKILKNPKFKAAWDVCADNPMMAMNYMPDPEIGPFIMKMMKKLRGGT